MRLRVGAIRRLSIAYHDSEWGRPVHDDRVLFEFLILEGAQAGLSWETILKKRESYRKAFAEFDPVKVARFSDKRVARLMDDAGIVRNRLKINSAVTNARAFLAVQHEFGSFDRFVWSFVGGTPRVKSAAFPWAKFQRARRSRTRSARTLRSAASSSSARPSAMRSCRPSGWWTITRSIAFGRADD